MACNTPVFRAVFDSTTLQAVEANGLINFTEFTSNAKCNTGSGATITLRNPGTYIVHFNATVSATAAGAQEIQMLRNGSPVAGAHAIETAAAVGDLASMAFATPITVTNGNPTTISFRATNATNIRIANAVLAEDN